MSHTAHRSEQGSGLPPRPPSSARCSVIGKVAAEVLAAGMRGRVLAVFPRSFYVRDAGGQLACIGLAEIGAGPLNALLDPPQSARRFLGAVYTGRPVTVNGIYLCGGEGFSLKVGGARVWSPPLSGCIPSREILRRNTGYLLTAVRGRAPAQSLCAMMLGSVGKYPDPLERALFDRVRPGLAALGEWSHGLCHEQPLQAGHPPAAAGGLIGLGAGLTPAGDDVIGGMLLALHALGLIIPTRLLGEWALPLAIRRSSPISTAHLAAAVRGMGHQSLHLVLVAWIEGHPHRWDGLLDGVAGLGHGSGWDALCGILLAFGGVSGLPINGQSGIDPRA